MKLYEKMEKGVYMIAEMSANHGGSLENALQIVAEAKKAGADCLKIQTYTADTLTIPCDNEYFKLKGGLWDGYTYYDLYKEAYTPWEWQARIKEKCDEVGIDFLSTPFDRTAVDFLEELGVEFYKIASFELVDIPLIEYVASKNKPMIISCGMASTEEILEAVEACRNQGNDNIVLLKCCSEYPANYSDMKVATICDMQQRFGLPIGLSDHSMGSVAAVVAVTLGARVIEKHVCLSRNIPSADSAFSMEMPEYRALVEDVHNALLIKGEPTYELTKKEKDSLIFRRSLFAVSEIEEGEPFTPKNVRSIRPGNGLKPKYYKPLLERKAKKSYHYGDPISEEEIRD
ncbi:MAG: N-acylneuraminate-9-phosphate synthase [Herbinix sp.]|jgi:N-acetylneuraminate synthase/pseudaminic acid synthase|nr:N-acylneuraminate-9-phosphate synthase [Herbinix sp.]